MSTSDALLPPALLAAPSQTEPRSFAFPSRVLLLRVDSRQAGDGPAPESAPVCTFKQLLCFTVSLSAVSGVMFSYCL